MRPRQGNRPDRRLASEASLTPDALEELAESSLYGGSALHKLRPGDYGFTPSVNPRPTKSACDDLRAVTVIEAKALLAKGIKAGMVSPFDAGGAPKYVWAVDDHGEVYEAKTKPPEMVYHGYRLGDDDRDQRCYIQREWEKRCPRI